MKQKIKDVVGEVHNRFTIVEMLPQKRIGNNYYKMVRALCECGEERIADYRDLKRGKRKSCGCINAEIKIDIEKENRYGLWTITGEAEPYITTKGKMRKVKAVCDCGTESELILSALRTGESKSCGCKNRVAPKPSKKKIPIPESTEEEQWLESTTYKEYLISSKGKVYSLKTQKYIKTEGRTKARVRMETGEQTINLLKEVYTTHVGEWDEEKYRLIHIDSDFTNNSKENIFLSRITKDGSNWVSTALSKIGASRQGKFGQRQKETTVVRKDIIDLYKKQEGLSHFLKIPFDLTGVDELLSVSVDRIRNDEDYHRDNITLVTRFENMGRRAATYEHFVEVCKHLKYTHEL